MHASPKEDATEIDGDSGYAITLEDLMDFASDSKVRPFSRADVKVIAAKLMEMAKFHEATFFRSDIRTHGPCLICFKDILYTTLSAQHLRYGEVWFSQVVAEAKKRPGTISHGGRGSKIETSILIGKYKWGKVRTYTCKECAGWVAERFVAHREAVQARTVVDAAKWRARQAEERPKNTEWLVETYRSSEGPLRFYDYSATVLRNFDSTVVASLPYHEFLTSRYWKMVKSKILYRDKYKCSLCSKKGEQIDVHHKTYEHHGQEHDYLEDLISLCHTCHSKFHDKYPGGFDGR